MLVTLLVAEGHEVIISVNVSTALASASVRVTKVNVLVVAKVVLIVTVVLVTCKSVINVVSTVTVVVSTVIPLLTIVDVVVPVSNRTIVVVVKPIDVAVAMLIDGFRTVVSGTKLVVVVVTKTGAGTTVRVSVTEKVCVKLYG
jgi:hypothetical protein